MSLSFLFAMDTRIAFLLVDVVDPVFFTSSGFRRFSFGIADDAVADAFPFVCREADFVEDFLSYGLFQFFFSPVDPAAAKAQGMSGQHEVFHDDAAVVFLFPKAGISQDQEDNGGAVERIVAFGPAADFVVHDG